MKKFTIILLLFTSNLFSQNNFTQEWESPADKKFQFISSWERNNSIPDIVFRSANNQTIFVYDGATKQLKYSYSDPDTTSFFTNAQLFQHPIDVNNDGIYEIISSKNIYNPYSFKLKVIDGANGQTLYLNTFSGFIGGTYLYDIDGDGYTEICFYLSNNNSSIIKLIVLSTTSNYVGIKNSDSEVGSFELKQNYPNPFNPNTKIEYTLSKTADVRLIIYDISGKEITSIINENQKAGTYVRDLNGSNLSTGTYFYQLLVNGVPETKKMILIK